MNFSGDRMATVDAARYIGVAPSTLANWRVIGGEDKPRYVNVGRRVYYRKSQLDEWLAKRERQNTPAGDLP